jgi:hypothetical protein
VTLWETSLAFVLSRPQVRHRLALAPYIGLLLFSLAAKMSALATIPSARERFVFHAALIRANGDFVGSALFNEFTFVPFGEKHFVITNRCAFTSHIGLPRFSLRGITTCGTPLLMK